MTLVPLYMQTICLLTNMPSNKDVSGPCYNLPALMATGWATLWWSPVQPFGIWVSPIGQIPTTPLIHGQSELVIIDVELLNFSTKLKFISVPGPGWLEPGHLAHDPPR